MEILDQKIHEAKDQLIERFEHICKQPISAAKFMWENNMMAGFDGVNTRSALKHGTLAIGQLGLAEALQILVGCDHTEPKGMELAKKIEALFQKRCKEFKTVEGRQQAYEVIKKHNIDALVVIGGDGSLSGARQFASEFDFPIVGLPGTIDNDLAGTDHTIGYDTALNTIMWCVDRIRDTASSHSRLFFIEVMGRESGFLALNGAIATGAEAAIIPEISVEVDQLKELIGSGFRKSKNSSIVLVAESPITGGAMGLAERARKEYPEMDVRVTILGHLQRGGSPTAQDRILASRMGAAAIDALLEGQRNVMIGDDDEKIVYVPFSKAIHDDKPIDRNLLDLLRRLSI
jgi:6-phosphofructokinase 1